MAANLSIQARPRIFEGALRLSGPDASGVIHVVGSGCWTPDTSDSHARELQVLIDGCRARGLDIRVLCDLRAMAVDCSKLIAHSRKNAARIYRPEDRIAVVVKTSLAKMQLRRGGSVGNVQMFLSIDAAETWLNAYARPADAMR